MRSLRWIFLVGIMAAFACVRSLTPARDPKPSSPQAAPPTSAAPAPEKLKKQRYSHASDFLIIGTVFDPKGFAFPGAELRVRRQSEKKFRWDTYTNSRGEFAVRVPQGSDYEMTIHAKGFEDQKRALDAKTGVSEARIVFRMGPDGGEKK